MGVLNEKMCNNIILLTILFFLKYYYYLPKPTTILFGFSFF